MAFVRKIIVPNLYWIGPILFLIYVTASVPLDYGFNSDSGLKLLQAKGILTSGVSKQAVFYPGEKIDPAYNYHPYKSFLIPNPSGGVWGQYPMLFATISAPILYLFGTAALVPFCILLYLLSIYLFKIIYQPSKFTVFFALICTPILIYSLEYSENTLFLLLAGTGLSIYFRNPDMNLKSSEIFISGFLIGLTVWFRLEPFIFIPALGLSILFGRFAEIRSAKFWKENLVFSIGILIPVASALFYNKFMYGHLLGPRFAASGNNYWDMVVKLKQLFVLLFFGYWKLGYFGYMPLLFFVFIDRLRVFTTSSLRVRILIILCIFYIPFISVIVGTEAFVNWGPRYLALAIFPSLMLLDDWYTSYEGKFTRLKLIGVILALVVSLWATFKGFQMIRGSYNQIKVISKELADYKADYILTGSHLISGHFGKLILTTPCFLPESYDSGEKITRDILSREKGKLILFIVSKYETKDVEQLMDKGDKYNLSSYLKQLTPHVLQYGNFKPDESEKILRLLNEKSNLIQQKENPGYITFLFQT